MQTENWYYTYFEQITNTNFHHKCVGPNGRLLVPWWSLYYKLYGQAPLRAQQTLYF